jgi:hypothetical protein
MAQKDRFFTCAIEAIERRRFSWRHVLFFLFMKKRDRFAKTGSGQT